MGKLDNKTAIITGGSSGIGKALIELFLNEGGHVVNLSRSEPTGIQSENFLHISCDLIEEDAVQLASKTALEFLGKIDVLVNNAGMGHYGNLVDMPSDQWRHMFDLNVHGLFYITQALLPSMIEQESGHILNISSIAGLNGVKGFSGYVGTKHAVRGISHSLYQELREYGIKVSTVYPGSTETSFFEDIPGVEANRNMMRPEDIAQSVLELVDTHPNYFPVDLEIRPLKPRG